jgi:hypothetical protein
MIPVPVATTGTLAIVSEGNAEIRSEAAPNREHYFWIDALRCIRSSSSL